MLFIYVAAIAAVVMGIVHSYLGERRVFPRLLASQDLPRLRGSLEVFGVSGLIAFVTTRGRHIAWPLFALVALASWFGVR